MINLKELSQLSSVIRFPEGTSTLIPFTDSRTVTTENLFIAIEGEKFNPLTFLDQLYHKQSCEFIAYTKNSKNDELIEKHLERFKFIETKDSIKFLQEFSRAHSQKWQSLEDRNLIGISGSNGKTTTKEMLFWLLKSALAEKVICTQKNNNNHIGVPLTVFQIKEETLCAIVELGSNHPGEMKVVCDACAPNIGFITNIGYTHMEFFPTLEDVYKEEGYLQFYDLKMFFKNGQDQFLKNINHKASILIPEFNFGLNSVSFFMNGRNVELKNTHITGHHNFSNLGTSYFIASTLYPQFAQKFVHAAQTFTPTANRSQWIQLKNIPCYLDAYNANPSSMKAALQGFHDSILDKGLKLSQATVVLGDMNELGDHTSALHNEIGSFLNQMKFGNVVFVGRYSQFYAKKYTGNATSFPDVLDYKSKKFSSDLSHSTSLFIKGSRSLQLEKLIDIT